MLRKRENGKKRTSSWKRKKLKLREKCKMEDEEKKRDVVKDKSETLTKHKRSKRNRNEILRKMQKVRRKMNWRQIKRKSEKEKNVWAKKDSIHYGWNGKHLDFKDTQLRNTDRERMGKKQRTAPTGIQTHDIVITRCEPYLCATTAAEYLINSNWTSLKKYWNFGKRKEEMEKWWFPLTKWFFRKLGLKLLRPRMVSNRV